MYIVTKYVTAFIDFSKTFESKSSFSMDDDMLRSRIKLCPQGIYATLSIVFMR